MEGKPWLSHYGSVPATLAPYPEHTLLDAVTERARQRPRHPALEFMGAALTYGELEAQSSALAAALALLGVRPGDRVALMLPNTPQFVVAEFGAWKASAIVAPLNPLYSDQELAGALNRTGAGTVVTLTRFYETVKRIQPQTPVTRVITTNIKDYLPTAARLYYTVVKERKEGDRVTLQRGDRSLAELIAEFAHVPAPASRPRPDDTAILLLSGGTTGTPKAVMGSHGALTIAGLQLRAWLRSILDEWNDSVLLPLPLFHVFANVGVQSLALLGGNTIVLVPNARDINALVRIIEDSTPAVIVMVPALLSALLNHRDVRSGKVDFRTIKGCFSGAAPLLVETKRQFEDATGGRIVEGYSLTEAMMACLANPVGGVSKPGSVGIPLPDVELLIVDPDVGDTELRHGAVGEVILRAPQLMQGYWENEAETARSLRPHGPGAPWLLTGDLGYLDDDGFLFIVDRKKDLIKVSGMQVWPREIEEVIATHPAVADVAAAGVADVRKGEVVQVWIVPRPGASATEADIRAYCRDRLAPYKVPTRVAFRESLPRNAAGKVLRRELKAEVAAAADAGAG
jgi:long-chain acyl-CoA synthetase